MKKDYTKLFKALYNECEVEVVIDFESSYKALVNLGDLRSVAYANSLVKVSPEGDRDKAIEYQLHKKKEECVRDALYLIFGEKWRDKIHEYSFGGTDD